MQDQRQLLEELLSYLKTFLNFLRNPLKFFLEGGMKFHFHALRFEELDCIFG